MQKFLVVIDMQNDFIDGSLGTKEAQGIVNNVCDKIEDFYKSVRPSEGRILVTMDTHNPDYLDTFEGKKLPVEHCIKYTPGWLINHKVFDALNLQNRRYKIFEKPTFGSRGLVRYMFDSVEEGLEITFVGLCTDICVISNVLMARAYFPDVKIVVDASCCAGVTPESHKAAIETMKMCQIDVGE